MHDYRFTVILVSRWLPECLYSGIIENFHDVPTTIRLSVADGHNRICSRKDADIILPTIFWFAFEACDLLHHVMQSHAFTRLNHVYTRHEIIKITA